MRLLAASGIVVVVGITACAWAFRATGIENQGDRKDATNVRVAEATSANKSSAVAPASVKGAGGGSGAKAAFDLNGWRLIGCCCGSPCPCRLNKKPLHCHGCDHTDAVHISKGYMATWTCRD
jgi:hypothetical protein